ELGGTPLEFTPHAVIHIRLRHNPKEIYRQACAWGEYNVILYKRYLPFGMPKLSPKTGIAAWLTLLRTLPAYFRMDLGGRAQFIWRLAWRIGRLKGSVKQRVFAL